MLSNLRARVSRKRNGRRSRRSDELNMRYAQHVESFVKRKMFSEVNTHLIFHSLADSFPTPKEGLNSEADSH